MCMPWQAPNAKEAILGRALPRVSFKAGKTVRKLLHCKGRLLAMHVPGVRFPKYAMSGKMEGGSWCNDYIGVAVQ